MRRCEEFNEVKGRILGGKKDIWDKIWKGWIREVDI